MVVQSHQFLVFLLDTLHYNLKLGSVVEVSPNLPIEPVPESPDFMRGVIFVRGKLIPVVDGLERMGLKRLSPVPQEPHIIVFKFDDKLIGLIVDEVLDLMELPSTALSSVEVTYSEGGAFAGMVESDGTLYRLIEPEYLMSPLDVQAVEFVKYKEMTR